MRPRHSAHPFLIAVVTGPRRAGLAGLAGLGALLALLAHGGGPVAAQWAAAPGTRTWECVPSVVKSDGSESFRVLVATDTDVSRVTMQASMFLNPHGLVELRDDGANGDAVAGDRVYTSPLFTPELPAAYGPLLDHFRRDPDSPAGMGYLDVGIVYMTETDGSVTEFLYWPDVGLIRPERVNVPSVIHPAGGRTTSHLVNIRHGVAAQNALRGLPSNVEQITRQVYALIEDHADFMVFLSSRRVERTPYTRDTNFNAGLFQAVKVDFDGTGRPRFDVAANYGSKGRLKGLVYLDTGQTGIYSANLVHELMHLWAPLLYPPILDASGIHYSKFSNLGSILGGFLWDGGGDEWLYVASRATGQILKYQARTGAFSRILADLSPVMPWAGGLYLKPGGNLFVSATSGSAVAEVNVDTGDLVRVYGSGGELINPRGMAAGPNNTLLVASHGTHQILKYDLATGAYLGVFASGAQMTGPLGMVAAPNGNLLVAGGGNNQIVEYHGATGQFVRVVASGAPMNMPFGLAFGPNGNLFVSSFNTDRILEYAWPGGGFVRTFAQGCALDAPTWIAFRSDGRLLVSNSAADFVIEYSETGQCVNSELIGSPVQEPRGLAIRPPASLNAVNCDQGRNGGHRAAPIDLYAMGLISASGVPDILMADPNGPSPLQSCGKTLPVAAAVPFSQVVGALGPRPAAQSRDFGLMFVVETEGRTLNAAETAFYHLLAEHVEKTIDAAQPDPYIGFNWAPLTRFFQAGTTWTSRLKLRLDYDGDADVDSEDIGLFDACRSGAGCSASSGCEKFDLDGDGDVDQSDYGLLQTRITGPARP